MEENMKNIKRILALVLAVLMTVGTVAVASAASITFSDTAEHWAWDRGYIPYLVEKDVLNGYVEGGKNLFKPDKEVKRSEFIKMLDEAFGLVDTKAVSFSDVKSSDWFCVYFQKAAAQGYLLDYGTSCDPEGKITREEAISLLVRYLDLDPEKKAEASTFADYDTINTKYRDYVLEAIDAELIEGYKQSNGSYLFKPQNTLTRAEALTILYRAAGCIYNKNYSYLRDEGAAETNSVITKSGVTIVSQTLTGRTIVSEGAKDGTVSFSSSEINDNLYIRGNSVVYLDTCKAENVEVRGNGGLYVKDTTIDNLVINKGMTITLKDDAVIKNITINPMAMNVKITGSGKIENITVKSSGLVSTVVPEHYEFINNITAIFDGKEYGQGTVSDFFSVEPFMSADKTDYYLEFTAAKKGSVYYYFAEKDEAPNVKQFNEIYSDEKTIYKGHVDVKADQSVSKKTVNLAIGKLYPYVVIATQIGTETSDPIVITTSAVDSNGFSTAPYFNSADSTVKFKTSVKGTVSYYYTDSVSGLTISKFNNEFAATESALKGTKTVTAKELTSVVVTSAYADKFDYIVFELKSESGAAYLPVYVTLADTGFTTAPAIKVSGEISYKANTSGTLYYYYSKTDDAPSSADFITNWTKASYTGSKAVTKNTDEKFEYKSSYAGTYPYIVIALRDASNNFKLPVVVELGNVSGYISLPKMKDETHVTLTTDVAGTVQYYLTSVEKAPTAEEFDFLYKNLAGNGSTGFVTTTGNGSLPTYITVPELTASSTLKYIVIMLKDSKGNCFAPIVLSLKYDPAENLTGFAIDPYVTDGQICFKTMGPTKIRYFYTSVIELDVNSFYIYYANANYREEVTAVGGKLEKIAINRATVLNPLYSKIAIAIWDGVKYSEPIILDGNSDSQSGGVSALLYSLSTEFTGFVNVKSAYTGMLYYFSTDSATEANEAFSKEGKSSLAMIANTASPISANGKKYLVLCLEANGMLYDKVVVDMSTGAQYVKPTYDSGANNNLPNMIYTNSEVDKAVLFQVNQACDVYYTLVGDTTPINPLTLEPYADVRGSLGSVSCTAGQVVNYSYAQWAQLAQSLDKYEHIYLYIQCVYPNAFTFYTPVEITLK